MTLRRFERVASLRDELDRARAQGVSIGVIPTMGALHDGHLSLVQRAKEVADRTVVTIFVNPTQFGPQEDFERYPRNLERDAAMLDRVGADYLFCPPVSEMYPSGEQTRVAVSGLSQGLCGAHRPGHFVGVATVVAKIFNAIGPGGYFFGEKDYQQLRVIQRMAEDLLFPVQVFGCPIVRQADGLAMSSRNAYLNEVERGVAPGLFAGLSAARAAYLGGERDVAGLLDAARTVIENSARDGATWEIEYLELRDALTLSADIIGHEGKLEPDDRAVVLLVAARLGTTRLIDNLVLSRA